MENASKALLIAGAILIAILLIAIGMMVFNSASGVVDTASSGMSDYEIKLFNEKFTAYQGSQSGSNLKNLLDLVHEHNQSRQNDKERVKLLRKSDGMSWTPGGGSYTEERFKLLYNNIDNLATYTVKCNDTMSHETKPVKDGFISEIEFTKQ